MNTPAKPASPPEPEATLATRKITSFCSPFCAPLLHPSLHPSPNPDFCAPPQPPSCSPQDVLDPGDGLLQGGAL